MAEGGDEARLMAQIGARVRALREMDQLSQSEWARLLELDRTLLTRVESGIRLPSLPFLLRVAHATDTTLDFLVAGLLASRVAPRTEAAFRRVAPELVDMPREPTRAEVAAEARLRSATRAGPLVEPKRRRPRRHS